MSYINELVADILSRSFRVSGESSAKSECVPKLMGLSVSAGILY